MSIISRKVLLWTVIALTVPARMQAGVGDSIRTVTPLFPPIQMEDETQPADPESAAIPSAGVSDTDPSVPHDGRTNSFPADQNIKVGTPRTESGVSPTGAATWSLMFDVPGGACGLTPDIGLVYNSQGSNGIAGWGMNITGISAITRGLKTTYYDNQFRGISYGADDALFLDGKRLLLTTGSPGTAGAVYVPEGDPYTTVTVTQSSSAAGPLTFEVVSPDGIVIRYGATDNSRVEFTNGAGQSRVLSWYVSSKDDPNANYMEYTYMQDHLTLYPTRISYGKNRTAGTGADNSIRFTYSGVEAGTIRTFVAGGVRGGVYKCLTEVRTMTGENVYRKYTLDYNPFLDSSRVRFERLVAVTVRNGAGEQLFPVVLDWNAVGNHEREVESFPFSMSSAHPGATILDSLFMAADMDGNGLADIIRLSKVRTDRIQTGYAYVHLASMGPDGLQYASTPHRIETGVLYDKGSQACVMGGKSVADLDGDGLSDVLVALYHVYGSERRVTFKAIYGKDIRTGADSTTLVRTVTLSPGSDMPMVVTGDIDGNGIDDILYMECDRHNGVYHAGLVRCMNGYSEIIQYPVTLPDDPKRIFLGDFNSDGLTDVIVFHDTGYSIFPYNGLLGDFFSNTGSIASTAITNQWKMEQGDFNGDGLEDVLYVGANRSRFYFALNNGDGSFDVRLAINSPVHGTSQTPRKNFHLLPTDLNHDGFTDLFVVHWDTCFSRTSYASIACWMVSDGSSLTLERMIRTHYLDDSQWYNYMLADFNGDGAPELMNYGHDVWTADLASGGNFCLNLYSSAANGTDAGLLSSATDGMGAETSFAYGSTSDPDVCTQSFGSGYPLRDAHWPLAVVRGMTKDQGMAGVHTSTCRYKGMVYHAQGRGLLGFTDKAVRDSQTGVTAQSGILSWNTYHYIPGMTYSVTTMGLEKDSTITTMNVGYNAKSRYLSLPAASVSLDMDGNTTAKTFQFNTTYGYPTLERTEYGSTGMYRQVTYSSHVRRGSRWLPQTEVSEQRHFHDTQVFRDSTTCSYDTAGNVTSRTEHASSEMAYTMSYTYDTYGNVTSKVGSFGNMTGPPSYYQYDPTGRFVTRKWGSADAGEWQYTHDAWGNVLTETDASEASSPLTTTFQRDGWGDVSSVTSPTGLAETVSSGWGTTRQSRFYVLREGQGKAPVKTWYDICGREHVRQTRTAGNALSTETISLTLRGDISQIVRTEGNRTCTEGYTYDSRGRVNWSYKTGFGATTYTYGNRSRTATCFSRDYTTTYDAWGNVLTSSDPLSSVEYTYGSIGKPVSVTSGESEITLAYDKAGRRIRIDDPDAGTSTSVYRADGKLLSHTDGRGIQTQNTYDALGRLVTSVCDTMTTTYTYGTSGYGKLRLVKRQAGSVSDEYTYDAYGRVVFSKRTFPDGVQTGHTFAYDSLGHLSSHMYPSNLTVTYTYDNNGYRNGVWVGNAHLWYLQSHDGVTARYHFGNTSVTDSVSMAGRLLERYVRRDGQGGKLCRMAFSWDGTTGNMTSRTGVRDAGVTESFAYDVMDRLTSVRQGSTVTDSLTYGAGGNILSRTGMGAYGYLSARPHAVTQVDNTAYMITSASQRIDYHPFGKAALIKEGNHSQRLFYGPDRTRWLQVDSVNGQATARTYYHDGFEMRVAGGHTQKYHYLEEGLLTYMYDSSLTDHYCLLTDNVGSVTHVVNGEGGTVFDAGYDAWGGQDVTKNDIGFFRGYGGHEMLPQYRLVNMGGRLYDYALGRFLSPDDYVQEPLSSQSFNRYSYCLNNPLKYTDPNGESFFGTIINFFKDLTVNSTIKVWTQGIKAWTASDNWHSTIMSYKIDTGMFRGSFKQIISGLTWEAPQTILGQTLANIQNTFYGVKSVSYFEGATAIETYSGDWGAFTLGKYVIGKNGIKADPSNILFQHEYGHYLQSQAFGPFYFQRVAMPSLVDSYKNSADVHRYHRVEQDANIRAYTYFQERENGKFSGWKFKKNPISGYKDSLSYYDPANQAALGRKLHLGWSDYLFGPLTVCPPITPSLVNLSTCLFPSIININLLPSIINIIAFYQ